MKAKEIAETSRVTDNTCGCGRPVRYRSLRDGNMSCNKYGRCPTYEELSLHLQKARILLFVYQEKRAVDGLNGRPWDAAKHHDAEAKIERLEKPQPEGK